MQFLLVPKKLTYDDVFHFHCYTQNSIFIALEKATSVMTSLQVTTSARVLSEVD